jgi:hypothetical protein
VIACRISLDLSVKEAMSLLDGVELPHTKPTTQLTSKDLYNAAKNSVVLIYSQTDEQPQKRSSPQDAVPPTKEEVISTHQSRVPSA